MDFAKRQLLRYGWSEGKGLGKNETGIIEALKPKLKFDTTGVGHDHSEQFTNNWWENVYNQAADNIKVEQTNDGSVNVQTMCDEAVNITTKKYKISSKKKNKNLEYGSFLKTSKLTADGVVDHEDRVAFSEEVKTASKVPNLTDEELFAVCGGRTAHKGARHGLKLNGKLARIQQQEENLLKEMKKQAQDLTKKDLQNTENYDNHLEELDKLKKHKKNKHKKKDEKEIEEVPDLIKKKKKTKKRTYSSTDNEDFIELEAVQKRTEYYCSKQMRKKKKIRQRKEEKKINTMTDMFESACIVNSQVNNKDDGFEENTKTKSAMLEDGAIKHTKKKHKKEKRKHKEEGAKSEDDGFEECINEVNEKLIQYKELRKDLMVKKQEGDERIISKMAEDFQKSL